MLTVEDVLIRLAERLDNDDDGGIFTSVLGDEWYARFVGNVAAHARAAKPLSTEQSRIVLRLLGRVRHRLIELGDYSEHAVAGLLAAPLHRRQPYQSSSIPREVRYLGDNKLAFRFKMNDVIISDLKALKPRIRHVGHDDFPCWNRTHRVWVVSVTRDTLDRIIDIISEHRFSFDEAVTDYLTLATNSRSHQTTVALAGNTLVINICDNEILATWAKNVLGAEIA